MFPIHFAPLQGYTEDVYRRAHQQICGGVTMYYTPFMRVEHREVRRKDVFDMLPEHNESVPLTLQVIASSAGELDVLLSTIAKVWGGGEEAESCPPVCIDINMGCPFPLQVRHGRGAGVLRAPERVEEICRYVSEHTQLSGSGRSIRWSVKMRLGVEETDEWCGVLPLLNAAPLTHLTVHPRVARQLYGGEPDMAAFESLMSSCAHAIIYNGDVTTVEQLCELERRYPELAGVMIGRGLLARPTLAREYAESRPASDSEVVEALRRLHEAVYESYAHRIPGEAQLLQKLRTFWDYAEPTLGRKAWKKIHKAGSMRNYLAAIAAL